MLIHIVHTEDDRMLRDILRASFQAAEPEVQLKQYTKGDEAMPYTEQNGQTFNLLTLLKVVVTLANNR